MFDLYSPLALLGHYLPGALGGFLAVKVMEVVIQVVEVIQVVVVPVFTPFLSVKNSSYLLILHIYPPLPYLPRGDPSGN